MRNGMSALRHAVGGDIWKFPSHTAVEHLEEVGWDWRLHLAAKQQEGWFYVFEPDGVCRALIGGWPAGAGVADLVVCVTEGIERYALSLVKACRATIEYERKRNGIHKIQATVQASDATALRFAEAFGMQQERLLPGYAPDGSDYVLMSREFTT